MDLELKMTAMTLSNNLVTVMRTMKKWTTSPTGHADQTTPDPTMEIVPWWIATSSTTFVMHVVTEHISMERICCPLEWSRRDVFQDNRSLFRSEPSFQLRTSTEHHRRCLTQWLESSQIQTNTTQEHSILTQQLEVQSVDFSEWCFQFQSSGRHRGRKCSKPRSA